MAGKDETSAEMEEHPVTIRVVKPEVDISNGSAPTQPHLRAALGPTVDLARNDILGEKADPVSVGESPEGVGGSQRLSQPEEETTLDDIRCSNTRQQTTESSGESECRPMVVRGGSTDSGQERRTTDGTEASQVTEERKLRETTDLLIAAATCGGGSKEKMAGFGQTVILFDPMKEIIGRRSLTDCMLLESGAFSNATAGNILLIRNVHQLTHSHPASVGDSMTGSTATLCAAGKAACGQLALLSNSNAGCQYQVGGSVSLSGSQTTSNDATQSLNSRKSDRLRAKPVGWKAWKNRPGGDDWVDLQDDMTLGRKRKSTSRLPPTAQQGDKEDEDGWNSKAPKLEETIVCGDRSRSVDQDKNCVIVQSEEANGDSTKIALASQSHQSPAAVVAAAASSSTRIHTCTICNKDFTTEKYLSMHMSLHGGSSYASGALLQPSARLGGGGGGSGTADLPIRRTKATRPGSMSQWTCKICEKTFAQNSNYKNHIRTHSNERPFVCEICSIGFKERYHLKKHELFKHTTQLNEKCRFCDKCFKDSTAVRAHERTHSDQRPYACTRCDKTFKTSECLWHHENRSKTCGKSLGELPFQRTTSNAEGRGPKPRRARQTQSASGASSTESRPHLSADDTMPQSAAVANVHQLMMSSGRLVQPIAIVYEESVTTSTAEGTVVGHRQKSDPAVTTDWSRPTSVNRLDVSVDVPTRGGGGGRRRRGGVTGEGVAAEGRSAVALNREGAGGGGGGGGEEAIPAVKVEMEMNIFDYDLTGIATSDTSLEEYCDDLEEREETDEEDDDDDDEEDEASVSVAERADERSASCYQHQQQLMMQQQQQQQQQQVFLQSRGRLDCDRCGKQCSTQSAYEKHCTVHSEARPHRCDECDIGFKLKVHLKKHNLYRHSDEYPCECSICGKRFKDSSAVRLHERIHSTERPFKCHCGKGFKTRENLWGHRHRGPCDKSEDFLMQNPRVFNSDIGPIWGVPLNIMSSHSMGNDSKPQDFSVPTTSHHYFHGHQQQSYNKDILASLAEASCSTGSSNRKRAFATSSPLFKREIITGETAGLQSSSSSPTSHSPSIAKFAISGSRGIACSAASASAAGTASAGGGAGVAYPPTAVVVPIKREVVDVSKSDGGQGIVVGGGGGKCSLPPFETLVTTHRPSPLTSTVDSADLEAAILDAAGPYTRSSIADRCPTVQKILLMNGTAGNVRVRLPGIQQLFQTHSPAGVGCIPAAAVAAVSETTTDVCRAIPADLAYYHTFGIAMSSSPSPVSTSSPILLSSGIPESVVRENKPHRTHEQQEPTNRETTTAGLVYLQGAEFCLPPPPPYPGLTSFPSAAGGGVSINSTTPGEVAARDADQLPSSLTSSCMSVVYWRRDEGGEEAFAPPTDDDHKKLSALSWQPSTSSSSHSELESALPASCSISACFERV